MGLKLKLRNIKIAQRVKAKIQDIKKSVQKAGGNAKDKAKNLLKRTQAAAAMALFNPFATIAVKYLQRRGVTPAKTNKGLVRQLRAVAASRNFGLADGQAPDSFDVRFPESVVSNYGLADDVGTMDPAAADAADIPSPAMVQMVIQFLVSIFKAIKAKKEAGQPLSEDEQKIADLSSKIDEAIEESKEEAEAIDKEGENEAGDILSGNGLKIALALLLLLVLFFVLRR